MYDIGWEIGWVFVDSVFEYVALQCARWGSLKALLLYTLCLRLHRNMTVVIHIASDLEAEVPTANIRSL